MNKPFSFTSAISQFILIAAISLGTFQTLQAEETLSFRVKMETPQTIHFDTPSCRTLHSQTSFKRLPSRLDSGRTLVMGSRVVLKLNPQTDFSAVEEVLAAFPYTTLRALKIPGFYALETSGVLEAARLSQDLSALRDVLQAYPEYELNLTSNVSHYSPTPNDKYWDWCWHLDQRDSDGAKTGWDMNARSAWALTRGQGVTIAVMDTGVSQEHPDLSERMNNHFHYNVFTQEASPEPKDYAYSLAHGTAVAGFAAASLNNAIGTVGMAPEADIAGRVMLGYERGITDLELSELFVMDNEQIRVQNQSWGSEKRMEPTSTLVIESIESAARKSNDGRGVLMVRSAGNSRSAVNGRNDLGDANNDFKNTLDTAIVVAAVDSEGCFASYSSPGANVLIAAPGGSAGENPTFLSTDFLGTQGYNFANYDPPLEDYNDYVSGTMIQGTSFSAPVISGLCALLLSANPELTVRDCRHILAQSAQFRDLNDPDTSINGAGFPLSHNCGFGIPDAGLAVNLARLWNPLPPKSLLSLSMNLDEDQTIPTEGFTLKLFSDSLEEPLSIPICICDTVFPDESTPQVPIVDLGLVVKPITQDLTGKAALIQRGTISFQEKINYAAQANAAFAIIYNNVESNILANMGNTYRCSIPAVFISLSSAGEIQKLLETQPLRAQLVNNPWSYSFEVDETLLCEDVQLSLRAASSDCGTLRVTLISPSGTRSLMHRYNFGGMKTLDWTFLSTHHFYEPTAGNWRVEISNMPMPGLGTYPPEPLLSDLSLTLHGIPITDTDGDALDDEWEMTHFNTLQHSATDILSPSGYTNARWQMMGDPFIAQAAQLHLKVDLLDTGKLRIAWSCAIQETAYEILQYDPLQAQWEILATVSGTVPETEYILPVKEHALLRVRKP